MSTATVTTTAPTTNATAAVLRVKSTVAPLAPGAPALVPSRFRSGDSLNKVFAETEGGDAMSRRVARFLSKTSQWFARLHRTFDEGGVPADVAALAFKTAVADRAGVVAGMGLPAHVASRVMSYVVALRRDASGARVRRQAAQARRAAAFAKALARAQFKAKAIKDARKAARAVATAAYRSTRAAAGAGAA